MDISIGFGEEVFWDRSRLRGCFSRGGAEEWRCAEREGDVLRCDVPLRW